METWKDVVGYESKYQVSDNGNVRSINFNKTKETKIMKYYTDPNGYSRICLCKNNIRKNYFIHVLVAHAHMATDINKPQINHINEIKTDNMLSNLEWMTRKENINHGTGILRRSIKRKVAINQINTNGEIIKVWDSGLDADLNGGFSRHCICMVCKGVNKTHKGFKWEYVQ